MRPEHAVQEENVSSESGVHLLSLSQHGGHPADLNGRPDVPRAWGAGKSGVFRIGCTLALTPSLSLSL